MLRIAFSLFISGVLFGWGPCLASCGPILISYVVGTNKDIFKGLKDYILFSIAKLLVYIVLALVIFIFGSFALERLLGKYSRYIFILGGGFIILTGLLIALGKRLEFKLCHILQRNIIDKDKQSVFILGLIIGFLPCGPLLAMLSYIGLISKSLVESLCYGLSFGLGTFLSPIVLLIMGVGLIPKFLITRQAAYSKIFSLVCGFIIIFFGMQLIMKGL
jgi:sulfite exporter TauE/SafE